MFLKKIFNHRVFLSLILVKIIGACTSSGFSPSPEVEVRGAVPNGIAAFSYVDNNFGGGALKAERLKSFTSYLQYSFHEGLGFNYVNSDRNDATTHLDTNSQARFVTQVSSRNIDFTINPLMLNNPDTTVFEDDEEMAIFISSFPKSFGLDNSYLGNYAKAYSLILNQKDLLESEGLSEDEKKALDETVSNFSEIRSRLKFFDEFIYNKNNGPSNVGGVRYSQYKLDFTNTVYSSLGEWVANEGAIVSSDYKKGTLYHKGYIVFGIETLPQEMPKTGKATYNGKMVGTRFANQNIYDVGGGFASEVDFESRKISTNIRADIKVSNADGTYTYQPWTTFAGEGVITDKNKFQGLLNNQNDPSFSGSMNGSFYGTSANEMGGVLKIESKNDVFTGAFVGSQN